MHVFISLFLKALGLSLVPMGWSLLRGLGFAAVAYVGISTMMEQAKEYVFSNLGAVPAEWLQMLGVLKFDVAINILFSAYIARAMLWGMNRASGSKTSIRWGGK